MKGFFEISQKFHSSKRGSVRTKTIPAMDGVHICSLFDGHYYPAITFPITFQQIGAKNGFNTFREFVFCRSYPVLISTQFKEQLQVHQITGWKTFPARLLDEAGNEVLGYEGFGITGCSGARDRSKCELIRTRFTAEAPLVDKYKGIYLDPATWDGSDIFIEHKYWANIISPKAAKVFQNQQALEVTPLEECIVKGWHYDLFDKDCEENRPQTYSRNNLK